MPLHSFSIITNPNQKVKSFFQKNIVFLKSVGIICFTQNRRSVFVQFAQQKKTLQKNPQKSLDFSIPPCYNINKATHIYNKGRELL